MRRHRWCPGQHSAHAGQVLDEQQRDAAVLERVDGQIDQIETVGVSSALGDHLIHRADRGAGICLDLLDLVCGGLR